MVSGIPSALPESAPKLDRMSLRTTPVVLSTLAPFDPSAGYGPCVSSGIFVQAVLPARFTLVLDVSEVGGDAVADAPQPRSWRALNDSASRISCRRSIAAPVDRRSRCSPPKSSWLSWG